MSTNEQDPAEILVNYSKVKLQCRVDRHRWGRRVSYEQMTPSFARRYVMCTECGTQRWTEINTRTFEWTGRSGYHYAAGYLTAKTGLTLNDFRERLYSEDYAAAVKAGRIEYRADAEVEQELPTVAESLPVPITKKKAS
jgi:hypothetical protein